jgi:acyl-CoA thioester hydrolase
MAASHEIRLKVPFHHLDPMRIVWHGNYMKYFDMARCGLFEAAGIDLYRWSTEEGYVFPITRTEVKHVAPLGPSDEFVCRATVTEAGYKIAMRFEIRRWPGGQICARAHSEQVAVKLPDMDLALEIPAPIRRALEGGSDGPG